MKLLNAAMISLACLLLPALSKAATICPTLTNASSAYYTAAATAGTNCNVTVTVNADNSVSVVINNTHPYDGSDDNYVGVINNSASALGSLIIKGNTDLFGFDGDGIDAYGITGNAIDTAQYGAAAYGGPDAYFTNITNGAYNGTVNFIGSLAALGGTGYFSLEEAPNAASFGGLTPVPSSVTPEPSSLILLGTGALGLIGIARRRLNF